MRKKLLFFLLVIIFIALIFIIIIASAIEDAMIKDTYKESDNFEHLIHITGDYHINGKSITVDILYADGENMIYSLNGKIRGDSFQMNKTLEQTVKATFTAYSPTDSIGVSDGTQGYDSRENKLKTVDYTLATPDYLPYGLKIRAKGIGKKYNKIYRANNTSSQLTAASDKLQLSILLSEEAVSFGSKNGSTVILSQQANVNGTISDKAVTLSAIIGDMEICLVIEDVEDEKGNQNRISNGYMGEGALTIADSGINWGETFTGTVEAGAMVFPLGSGYAGVSGEWGMRQHPIYNVQRMHDGMLMCDKVTQLK